MIQPTHGLLRDNASMFLLVQRLIDPVFAILCLVVLAQIRGLSFITSYQLLAATTLLLMLTIFKAVGLYQPYRTLSPQILGLRLFWGWSIIVGLLLFLGYITKTSALFSRALLLTWVGCVPLLLFGLHLTIWRLLRQMRAVGLNSRKAVIAGVNPLSLQLAQQIRSCKELGIHLRGFFEDASSENSYCVPILGTLDQLPQYVSQSNIDVVYLACPIEQKAAIISMIEGLKDTTACVYFVPNLLVSNLLHGRSYELNGVPLIAIWEIPFSELQYLFKRGIDIIIATLAIIILSPLMLAIAIAIKASSRGPILFRQRRYGLNGQEIVIYKFRTMHVMEDGDIIPQARRNDSRVTKIGAFLRKTSLDEVPQFINVLQGHMSIVGPRPHAVAHNEMYRKLIDGYMLRHKIKPGITGWAQVNGCRGETSTLEKMRQRVRYDLEYLKNWSLGLDLHIMLRTTLIFFNDQNAY